MGQNNIFVNTPLINNTTSSSDISNLRFNQDESFLPNEQNIENVENIQNAPKVQPLQQPTQLQSQRPQFNNKLPLYKDYRVLNGVWNIPFWPFLYLVLSYPFIWDKQTQTYESIGEFRNSCHIGTVITGLSTLCAILIMFTYPQNSIHYKINFETWSLRPNNYSFRWINLIIQITCCVLHCLITTLSPLYFIILIIIELIRFDEITPDTTIQPICWVGFIYLGLFCLWSLIGLHLSFFAFWKEAQCVYYSDQYTHGDENIDIQSIIPPQQHNVSSNQGNFQQHSQHSSQHL
jgi:hypothetical protein